MSILNIYKRDALGISERKQEKILSAACGMGEEGFWTALAAA